MSNPQQTNALQSDNNRAQVDRAVKDAYAAVEEAKENIRQCTDGPATMMAALDEIDERIDRIDTEMLSTFGDVRQLKALIHQLYKQHEDIRKLIWALVKKIGRD
jgi:hypothetical protein